jgi:hypothetical protein
MSTPATSDFLVPAVKGLFLRGCMVAGLRFRKEMSCPDDRRPSQDRRRARCAPVSSCAPVSKGDHGDSVAHGQTAARVGPAVSSSSSDSCAAWLGAPGCHWMLARSACDQHPRRTSSHGSRPVTGPDQDRSTTASDRDRPFSTGAHGTLMPRPPKPRRGRRPGPRQAPWPL